MKKHLFSAPLSMTKNFLLTIEGKNGRCNYECCVLI